jgi:prepilin peptidase CpaA
MRMRAITWWPVLTLLVLGTVSDFYCRRIPSWLVLPFLAAGVVVRTVENGLRGFG